MIIYNLTEKMLYDLLMETIEDGHNKEMEERERLLDYYEGINLENDIKGYFDSESLSQIPPMYINLVRNIISRRALVYQQSPVRFNDKYNEVIGDLDSFMKQFEQLTYLLGTEALYTHWDDVNKKLKYRPIHFFTPFFKPNEDEPFAIMYQAESHLQARTEDAQYMFWSKDTEDMEEKHDLIDYVVVIDFYQNVLKKEREQIEEDKKKKLREVELWTRATREEEKIAIEKYASEHGDKEMEEI